MPGPYDLTREDLAGLLDGEPRYRVDQVWDGLHRRAVRPGEMTELPAPLRARLEALSEFEPALQEVARRTADRGQTVKGQTVKGQTIKGQTIKWQWALADGSSIETVLMRYKDRTTVCVSTQAGCAMGCGFCATGQAGFSRHLSCGEIVEQVSEAIRAARPQRISNVVFMGMGEPLANYDQVWAAITRLHDEFGISARHLTVSTVGIVPGIRRLAQEVLPVNLAVSLHAANDQLRNQLVPINRQWPLASLTEACRMYLATKGRRLSFEWALIDRVNDRPGDAAELARLARSLRAHVNLIPLNPTPGFPTRGSSPAHIRAFQTWLAEAGVNATIRQNRGTDIDAACGQLAAGRPARPARPTPVALRGAFSGRG
ncbi:MAG TPA: 23S rRNA (adenine(2503)-C(2))-methyltransferase RlmN [Acidimicrobiales bacterium]